MGALTDDNLGWIQRFQAELIEMLRMRSSWKVLLSNAIPRLEAVSSADIAISLLKLCDTHIARRSLIDLLILNDIPVPLFQLQAGLMTPSQRNVQPVNLVVEVLEYANRCSVYPLLVNIKLASSCAATSVINNLFESGFEEHHAKIGLYHEGLAELQLCSEQNFRGYHLLDIHGNGAAHALLPDILPRASAIVLHISPDCITQQMQLKAPDGSVISLSELGVSRSHLVVFAVHRASVSEYNAIVKGMKQRLGFAPGFVRVPDPVWDDQQKLELNQKLYKKLEPRMQRGNSPKPEYLNESSKSFLEELTRLYEEHKDGLFGTLFPLSMLAREERQMQKEHDKKMGAVTATVEAQRLRAELGLKKERLRQQRVNVGPAHPLVESLKHLLASDVMQFERLCNDIAVWSKPHVQALAAESLQCKERIAEKRIAFTKANPTGQFVESKEELEKIRSLNDKMNLRDISIIHFLRELMDRATCPELADSKDCSDLVVRLVQWCFALGLGVELLNGESLKLNTSYLSAFLDDVKENFEVIFTLGPQSSGKSWIQRLMFGVQFEVGAGRCTTGVHAGLCKRGSSRPGENPKPILCLDSEGLSSFERGDPEFDKKVVLFAFSVASKIMINIKGNVVKDMADLIQTVTWCFARLSLPSTRPTLFMVLRFVDAHTEKDLTALTNSIHDLWAQASSKSGDEVRKLLDFVELPKSNVFFLPSAFTLDPLMEWREKSESSIELYRCKYSRQFLIKAMELRRLLVASKDELPKEAKLEDRNAEMEVKQGPVKEFPRSLKKWCDWAPRIYDNWILAHVSLVSFPTVAAFEEQQRAEKVLRDTLEEVFGQTINPAIEALLMAIAQVDQGFLSDAQLNEMLLPQLLWELRDGSFDKIKNAQAQLRTANVNHEDETSLKAMLPYVKEVFLAVLDFFFCADHQIPASERYLSLGQHQFLHRLEDGFDGSDCSLLIQKEVKGRCWKILNQRHNQFLLQFDTLLTANVANLVMNMRVTGIANTLGGTRIDNCDPFEAQIKQEDEKWRKDNPPPDMATVQKQVDSIVLAHIAATHRFNSTMYFNSQYGAIYESLVSEHAKAHKGPMLANVMQEIEKGGKKKLSRIAKTFKSLVVYDSNEKSDANYHFIDAVEKLFRSYQLNPSNVVGLPLETRVKNVILKVEFERAETHTTGFFRPKVVPPAQALVSLAYGLLLHQLFQQHYAKLYELHSTKLTIHSEKLEKMRARVRDLVNSAKASFGTAQEFVDTNIWSVLRQVHGDAVAQALGLKFGVGAEGHSLGLIERQFYEEIFSAPRQDYDRIWNFLMNQSNTLEEYFLDKKFIPAYDAALSQFMEMEQTKMRTNINTARKSAKLWCACMESFEARQGTQKEILGNLAYFIFHGRFPRGSAPCSAVTKALTLTPAQKDELKTIQPLTVSKSLVDIILTGIQSAKNDLCDSEEIGILRRSIKTAFDEKNHVSVDLASPNSTSKQMLGKEFLAQCWGERCPEACPFCKAICSVNHASSTTVSREHSCTTHFLLAFGGWRGRTSNNPFIFSCVDSSRHLKNYQVRSDPAKFIPFDKWLEVHYPPPTRKWHIEEKADHEFLTLSLEKNIRRAYVNMQKRFATYWHYNEGVPEEFANLYTANQLTANPFTPLPRAGRVLVLCGGGVRGLMQLRMLHQLEIETGKRIYELFDLIVGTSVGAINAAAIGLLKWPVKSCLNLFQEISKSVFPAVSGLEKGIRVLKTGSMYDSQPLAELLKVHFGYSTTLADYHNTWPKVCIISAVASVNGTPTQVNFRTYDVDNDAGAQMGCSRAVLWKALLASASAPNFSECTMPITEGGEAQIMVDGGIVANNGARTAISEGKILFRPPTGGYLHSIVCVGTGKLANRPLKEPGLCDVFGLVHKLAPGVAHATSILILKKIIADSEAVHAEVSDLSKTMRFFYSYLNFTLGDGAMDNSSNSYLEFFEEEATKYLTSPEGKANVAATVCSMVASSFVVTGPSPKDHEALQLDITSEYLQDSWADLQAVIRLKRRAELPVAITASSGKKATLNAVAQPGVLEVTFKGALVLNGRFTINQICPQ